MNTAHHVGICAAASPVSRRRWLGVLFVWSMAACMAAAALAQPPADKANRARRSKGSPELRPREVKLTTKDGVRLRMGYFPSDQEKAAVPVILVHEWGGQGSPYVGLARELQNAGCAVLLPDLRGHGGSNLRLDRRGNEETIDPNRMGRADAAAILRFDLETIKGFLREENDQGRVNLNALVLIGVGEGAVLASNWAVNDWSWPALPGRKQGQDVRALVLISPVRQAHGMSMEQAVRHLVVGRLPTLVITGAQSDEANDAERLIKLLERNRNGRGPAGPLEFQQPATALSGARLLAQSGELTGGIVSFLRANVLTQQERYPWIER